jgi:hypothetical protein
LNSWKSLNQHHHAGAQPGYVFFFNLKIWILKKRLNSREKSGDWLFSHHGSAYYVKVWIWQDHKWIRNALNVWMFEILNLQGGMWRSWAPRGAANHDSHRSVFFSNIWTQLYI